MDRVIGKYIGKKRGPMLILFGAMHGNEPAGVEAIKMIFRELALEPYHNPSFEVKGSVLGLIGNVLAFKKGVRYINKDLNRCWTEDFVNSALNHKVESNKEEANEIVESLRHIKAHIRKYEPTEIITLDIHTTSSKGGIFSIISNDQKSMDIALSLHAPVVTGILEGLVGTTIHFFKGENMNIPTTALSFEAGQHEDILSPGRAYSAIVNCLKAIGSVKDEHVENRHEKILIEFSKNLPSVTKLLYKYSIPENHKFKMIPGFVSFDKVKKGDLLAYAEDLPIRAENDGRILMPLYQIQGEEGFFIVKEEKVIERGIKISEKQQILH